MQRYYPDINTRVSVALPMAWELIQELKVLNFLQKINFVIKNYFYNYKFGAKTLYENIYYKISINWNNNKNF